MVWTRRAGAKASPLHTPLIVPPRIGSRNLVDRVQTAIGARTGRGRLRLAGDAIEGGSGYLRLRAIAGADITCRRRQARPWWLFLLALEKEGHVVVAEVGVGGLAMAVVAEQRRWAARTKGANERERRCTIPRRCRDIVVAWRKGGGRKVSGVARWWAAEVRNVDFLGGWTRGSDVSAAVLRAAAKGRNKRPPTQQGSRMRARTGRWQQQCTVDRKIEEESQKKRDSLHAARRMMQRYLLTRPPAA